jgi:DNA-binding protein Fis
MIKRLFLYFSVVLVIVLVATSFNRFVIDKKKTVTEVIDETGQLFTSTEDTADREVAQENNKETLQVTEDIDPRFSRWFQSEAALVNSTSVDQKAKEVEMREMAKTLTPKQIQYLQKKAAHPQSPQVEKILSVYLLSLGGEATQGALVETASNNPNLEPAEPHSLQEVQNNQERASRIIAIDTIAESNKPLSLRIAELQKIIQQQQDATIKNYAQRKQSELQSQL